MNRPKPTSLTITFPPDATQGNRVPSVGLDSPLLIEHLIWFAMTCPTKAEIKLTFASKRQASQWQKAYKKAAEALIPPAKTAPEKSVSAQK